MADTAIRPKNYTDEMVASMTAQYEANPSRDTVDALATEMGKSVRSIIAKLSREGVYVAQPKVTKSGEPVVRKTELVLEVANHFGIEMPTLVKASKADLQKLVDALNAQTPPSEVAFDQGMLQSLRELVPLLKVQYQTYFKQVKNSS